MNCNYKEVVNGAKKALKKFNPSFDVLLGYQFAEEIGYYQNIVPTNNYYYIRDYYKLIYYLVYSTSEVGKKLQSDIEEEARERMRKYFEEFSDKYKLSEVIYRQYSADTAMRYSLEAKRLSKNKHYLRDEEKFRSRMLEILEKL